MITFKYSRADEDKTADVINRIKQLSALSETVYVIVPEQLSLQREFSLGGIFPDTVKVLSFARLADEIFRVFGGGAKKRADNAMVSAAVYKAVLESYDSLEYFKSVAKRSGFISKLVSAFSEFDTNCMTSTAVFSVPEKDMPPSVRSKYRDLFLIYDNYKKLWQQDYKAPDSDIAKASGILELNSFFESSSVIFDGFYGFTPEQLLMLEQIALQASSCTFYFTTDRQSEVFLTVNKEIDRLSSLFKKLSLSVSFENAQGAARIESKAVKTIERYAFERAFAGKAELCENDGLTVYRAKNLSDELSFIACKIKNDVLSGKYRYRDIAVLAPDAQAISTVATAVFEKHGIPLYSDVKRTLLSKPLMAFVLSAFEIVNDGFEFENIFSFLKTGLTGIAFDDISLLENYVRMWKIRNKGWIRGGWTQSPSGISGGDKQQDAKRLEKLNGLRERIYTPLCEFSGRLRLAKTCTDVLSAIYKLTESFNVRDNLETIANSFLEAGNIALYDEYTRVYDIFIDMLDSIETVFGKDMPSVADFGDILSVCAASITVSHRPSKVDEVVLAGIGLVREENVKCVYIPCMNDGVLPKPYSDSGIITESDKRLFMRYGVPVSMDFIAKAERERFDLYVAMTAPSQELVLSMSDFEITGELKQPSEYLSRILKLTDLKPLTRDCLAPEFFLVSVAAAGELASICDSPELTEAILEITGFTPITDTEHQSELDKSIVQSIYSNQLRLSFSGIEEYVGCPFKFYLNRGLKLGKNEPVEFNPANMGTFIHAGLERLLGGDYDIMTADRDQIRDMIEEISMQYYENDLKDCKGRSRRFDYLFGRAKYALENAAVNVVSEIQNSDFAPFDFEIDISEYVKPVTVDGGLTLSLVGSIDRVDMSRRENDRLVKIIDYKSGSQKFSLKKIYNGLSMQLPIYASAVRSKHGDVKLAAMYYLSVGVPKLQMAGSDGMSDSEYLDGINSCYTRDGLFSGEEGIMQSLDKKGDILKKVKKTSIVTDEQMNKLIDYTNSKVKEIGTGILNGNIKTTPVCDKEADTCRYCDYKTICGIDRRPELKRSLDDLPDDFLCEGDKN